MTKEKALSAYRGGYFRGLGTILPIVPTVYDLNRNLPKWRRMKREQISMCGYNDGLDDRQESQDTERE